MPHPYENLSSESSTRLSKIKNILAGHKEAAIIKTAEVADDEEQVEITVNQPSNSSV